MTDISGDSLEFHLKLGTVGTDGVREDVIGEEDPSGMLQTTSEGVVHDPEEAVAAGDVIDAAIASLSRARKCLGQAREAIKKVPDALMTELARGEATQEIVVACAWVEEARECLKKPLADSSEFAEDLESDDQG